MKLISMISAVVLTALSLSSCGLPAALGRSAGNLVNTLDGLAASH
jgi:hypothetical protein